MLFYGLKRLIYKKTNILPGIIMFIGQGSDFVTDIINKTAAQGGEMGCLKRCKPNHWFSRRKLIRISF
jgi:hypothetical protein